MKPPKDRVDTMASEVLCEVAEHFCVQTEGRMTPAEIEDEHRQFRIRAFNDETAAHLETERLRRLNQAHYVKTETRILSLVTRH